MSTNAFRYNELDRTRYPGWRDAILAAEASGAGTPRPPRRYPGYPIHPLPRLRPRLWPPLDRVLAGRRCTSTLCSELPSPRVLGRLLGTAHSITAADGRGPTPSAGALQALELYPAVLSPGWLRGGVYHYDRAGHHLARLAEATREEWLTLVPSLQLVQGGGLLWILVGDGARATAKYSERGLRFLLLEAGHLMQSLCLASASLRLVTVPLGGYFEAELARKLALPPTDEVLYVGVCGWGVTSRKR
jgi:SagB-type dehydrogenase family enzyme